MTEIRQYWKMMMRTGPQRRRDGMKVKRWNKMEYILYKFVVTLVVSGGLKHFIVSLLVAISTDRYPRALDSVMFLYK